MAVVTGKSTQITNRDASPRVINNGRIVAGEVKRAVGNFAIANGDSVASKFIVCSVPSRAVMKSVQVSSPDIGTTTAADVGLYRTTQDGGAVVDADFFASALSLSGGALAQSEVRFESGVVTIANIEKPIWEILGLSADPCVDYDVVLTLTGAADAAGTGLLEVEYAI
jgi:hypothetical protein